MLSSHFPSVGLKHVSDDQKTHKNPNLRSQQPTTAKGKNAGPVASPTTPAQKRPPLLELEGKKWRVVRAMCKSYFEDHLYLIKPTTGAEMKGTLENFNDNLICTYPALIYIVETNPIQVSW